jgi:Rod binding domain-containing protein
MSSFPVSSTAVNAADLLQGRSLPSKGTTAPAQLRHAATEFESILLSQWLQGAESSFGSVPGADDDEDAGDEQMKNFAVQALAKSFSDSGGIGLAKIVSSALAHTEAATPKPQPPPPSGPGR